MAAESLILFAKLPLPGRVKTRLAQSLGRENAARLYACFLRDAAETARVLRETRLGVSLVCEWALERGETLADFPLADWLPGAFIHRAQTGADIGARMSAALGRCLATGDRAVLIGTDFPDLPVEILLDAFMKLECGGESQVVLGPASDGGYYLIGMNRFVPKIFIDVPWSVSDTLSQTLKKARAISIETTLLPEWCDVDEANDVENLKRRLFQDDTRARYTREYLR